MRFSGAMAKILRGQDLSASEANSVFHSLFTGKLSDDQTKSLLLLLALKGESPSEVYGCLRALKELEPPARTSLRGLLDTCGTGGDASHLLNVSTLAAFVIAGAGGRVAKHGNRAISSKCGSSDLMEALGVNLEAGAKRMTSAIHKAGIGYFHAPYYHPVFCKVQRLRRSLKVRTLFNFLGPLMNPLRIESQLLGVSRPGDFTTFVEVLRKTGQTALVCHSLDGLDEISIAAPTRVAYIKNTTARVFILNPEEYGFRKTPLKSLKGGSLKQNTALAKKILTGNLTGPARDIVVLNAAAGLWISGHAKTLKDGIGKAQKSLDSGEAYRALNALKSISRGLKP